MDDYIRRFDAIDSITDDSLIRNMDSIDDGWIRKCERAAQRVLASIPAADVISVVRCKDCKHWCFITGCGMACKYTNMIKSKDGFCDRGERISDEV